MSEARPIRVMLAEDHGILRDGLKVLLEVEGDIAVVATAVEGREAVDVALRERPDVVLMDVRFPGMDGIEATRRVHAQAPELRVLMLSAHPELHLVRAAIDAGALGYLHKREGGVELRRAVRVVAAGEPYFSDGVIRAVWETARPSPVAQQASAESPGAVLTRRECEVLQLVASGRSNREIAALLGLSPKTVDTHRTRVMAKLDIHDAAGLTRYAIHKGLIE